MLKIVLNFCIDKKLSMVYCIVYRALTDFHTKKGCYFMALHRITKKLKELGIEYDLDCIRGYAEQEVRFKDNDGKWYRISEATETDAYMKNKLWVAGAPEWISDTPFSSLNIKKHKEMVAWLEKNKHLFLTDEKIKQIRLHNCSTPFLKEVNSFLKKGRTPILALTESVSSAGWRMESVGGEPTFEEELKMLKLFLKEKEVQSKVSLSDDRSELVDDALALLNDTVSCGTNPVEALSELFESDYYMYRNSFTVSEQFIILKEFSKTLVSDRLF